MSTAKKIKVRVLLDEPALGLECGKVYELDSDLAKSLLKGHRADATKEAIAVGEVAELPAAEQVIED